MPFKSIESIVEHPLISDKSGISTIMSPSIPEYNLTEIKYPLSPKLEKERKDMHEIVKDLNPDTPKPPGISSINQPTKP